MRVFVTGATGFVGRALTLRLLRDGHQVVAWVRSEARGRQLLGGEVIVCGPWSQSEVAGRADDEALREALRGCDAVVHLAGESVIGKRWTDAYQRALVDSRVALTERLVRAMAAAPNGPRILVSASAVGYYGGDHGDTPLDESSPLGQGFLAELCRDWEAAAVRATENGVRVAVVRIGLVLGKGGGALDKMLAPFRAGLGGPLGRGRQYMPWIHLEDLVELFATALVDPRWTGIVNGVGPAPVTNAEFARTLGRVLRRPALFPAPTPLLRLLFGRAADAILAGQNARPARALALGFHFRHPSLEPALRALLSNDQGLHIGAARTADLPAHEYVRARRPTRLLRQETLLHAPLHEVFSFFASAENLNACTPPDLTLDIQTPRPIAMHVGARIDYRLRLGPIPMKWRTVIEAWTPDAGFIDAQHRGPYRAWWHEHHFTARGNETLMEDRVYFATPLGFLGRIANWLFVEPMLRRIFSYRASAMALRFGARAASASQSAAQRASSGADLEHLDDARLARDEPIQ